MHNRIVTAVLAFSCCAALAQGKSGAQIASGKYIVENVAVCTNCHTPRNAKGELMRGRWLMGATLRFIHPLREGRWATNSPQLAGLPAWEDEEVVILLTTGTKETKITPRPPMPAFHMTNRDAEAVVAYLKSVKPARKP